MGLSRWVMGRNSRWTGCRSISIGIRREEKNRWEMRAPLTPAHVKELKKLKDVQVTVQPCTKRIFTDKEYEKVSFSRHPIISTPHDRWGPR